MLTKKIKLNSNFINQYCKKKNILKKEEVIISVSGGVDSIVIFYLLKKYFTNSKNIHLIIFDHESRSESSFEIKSLLAHYKMMKIYTCKVYKIRKKIKKSDFQNSARQVRLKTIFNYAKKNKIKNIFLGHHYDDLIETFFLRKIQISGISGLLNIFSEKFNKLNFNRPLLAFSKKEIIRFAILNSLKWYEDKTNSQNIYTRNKIRSYLSDSVNKKNICSNMHSLKKVKYIDLFIDQMMVKKLNTIQIDKKNFNDLPAIMQKYMIHKIMKFINVDSQFRSTKIDNIRQMISLNLSVNKKRSIKGGFIEFYKEKIKFISIKPFKEAIL